MKTCIFCDQKAGSREHLFPEWILKRVPPRIIRGDIGPNKNIDFGREIIVKTVCVECNNGWMHKLEYAAIPVIGPLIDDCSTFLNSEHQQLIAVWSLKTVMVLDSATTTKERPIFYSPDERIAIRERRKVPQHTAIWIGRSLDPGLAAYSTGIRCQVHDLIPPIGLEKTHPGHVGTLLLGSLAIQVLTLHPPAEYLDGTIRMRPNEGAWDELLFAIRSPYRTQYWPPVLAFDSNIPELRFSSLPDRWKQGVEKPVF